MIEINEYFKRIGLEYQDNLKPNFELLKALHYAHVTHVPYETTEIVDNHPLSLKTDDLFKKIIIENRGGYCFELNGLFSSLLTELGYEVKEYFGRFLKGEIEPPKPRHRVIVVTINDKKYICDVGVGCRAPKFPLLLEENTIQCQGNEKYKLETDDTLGWIIYEYNNEDWEKYYSFTENIMLPNDFLTPSYYCENHPDSPFKRNMLSLKTSNGRITIDNNTFRIWENEKITTEIELNETELNEYCSKYFGMKIHR